MMVGSYSGSSYLDLYGGSYGLDAALYPNP